MELSTGTEDYDDALAMLRKKVAAAEEIGQIVEHPERVRMSQLFDLLLNWYTLKERRTTNDVKSKIEKKNGLRVWFGKMKPQEVVSKITGYVAWHRREKKPPQNATINR